MRAQTGLQILHGITKKKSKWNRDYKIRFQKEGTISRKLLQRIPKILTENRKDYRKKCRDSKNGSRDSKKDSNAEKEYLPVFQQDSKKRFRDSNLDSKKRSKDPKSIPNDSKKKVAITN